MLAVYISPGTVLALASRIYVPEASPAVSQVREKVVTDKGARLGIFWRAPMRVWFA